VVNCMKVANKGWGKTTVKTGFLKRYGGDILGGTRRVPCGDGHGAHNPREPRGGKRGGEGGEYYKVLYFLERGWKSSRSVIILPIKRETGMKVTKGGFQHA